MPSECELRGLKETISIGYIGVELDDLILRSSHSYWLVQSQGQVEYVFGRWTY